MSVIRNDLNLCQGSTCRMCEKICPMDVMYFSEEHNKSVIAYVDNCMSCGQCWLNCPSHSLGFQTEQTGPATNAGR
ncbi:4Fe-4S dicluster domain-containing protein [Eggerthella sp. NSJ-70]|uniref:4Fe-4S dicluster domain-containing protein n=1 Tax=Eggerthella hominis TaxID=2763043 RepID=A0ABR7BRK7_9ACTN|nr:4Fe-4S dicluster domain-containing protein [Eggerthella hominis]MBC5584252.1 4Fe-4S dicluster domain-containing protein [Eggerthella hominis]